MLTSISYAAHTLKKRVSCPCQTPFARHLPDTLNQHALGLQELERWIPKVSKVGRRNLDIKKGDPLT